MSNRTTHGYCGTRVYVIWKNMTQRCLNPNNTNYPNYGGRGITVCKRWLKFENFLADMGEPLTGLTLERKDNSVSYKKSNCIWADMFTQQNNRRNSRKVQGKTIGEWSRELGTPYMTLWNRWKNTGTL